MKTVISDILVILVTYWSGQCDAATPGAANTGSATWWTTTVLRAVFGRLMSPEQRDIYVSGHPGSR